MHNENTDILKSGIPGLALIVRLKSIRMLGNTARTRVQAS